MTQTHTGVIKTRHMLFSLQGKALSFVSSGHTVLLTTWGLGFRGFQTLASACALHLPTVKVQIFCIGLRVEDQCLVRFVIQQCFVFGVKSEVQGA